MRRSVDCAAQRAASLADVRRHLPHQIAVAGIRRDVEEAFAVAVLDPGLDGDDLAFGGLRDRAGDGDAFGQKLEVLGRGVDQGAAAGGGLVDRLLRRRSTPSSTNSDPSCSAIWSSGASARKNQVSKRRGAKVGVIQWAKGTMRSVASSRSSASTRSTMLASSLASLARHFSSIAFKVGGGDDGALAALARQQDAAFLEGLAHAGDPELQLAVADLVGTAAARAQPGIAVGVLQLAAGKHQRAGEGVDLVMAHHHEDFERRGHVAGLGRAHQQHGRRGTRLPVQRRLCSRARLARGCRGARRRGFFLRFVHFSLHWWDFRVSHTCSDSAIGGVYSGPASSAEKENAP